MDKKYFFDFESIEVYWAAGTSDPTDITIQEDVLLLDFLKTLSTLPAVIDFNYISSGGTIYGENPGLVNELSPIYPETFYAKNKAHCEEILVNQSYKNLQKIAIFRVANAYTLQNSSNRRVGLVERLYDRTFFNTQIQIHVDMQSRKQYASHKDYVTNILNISAHISKFDVINIFSPYSYSIAEIIECFVKVMPVKKNFLDFLPPPVGIFQNVILSNVKKPPGITVYNSLENSLLEALRTIEHQS